MTSEDFHIQIRETRLAGTLTLPEAPGKFPAAIIMSGGEPDNRDGGFFGFRPFKMIAEHLASRGIATLRLDDPGVGASKGKHFWNYRFSELEYLGNSVFDQLCRHEKISNNKVGLIGFRQGGVIANLIASNNNRIAYVCNLATGAVTGEKQIRTYKNYLAGMLGFSPANITENILAFNELNEAIRRGKGQDLAFEAIIELNRQDYHDLDPDEKRHFSSFESYFGITHDAQILKLAKSPMYLDVLDFDPTEPIKRLQCPALVLFSNNDPWLDHERNELLYRKCLSNMRNADFTFKTFKGVGQYFTREITMPNSFADGFLETISHWIISKV